MHGKSKQVLPAPQIEIYHGQMYSGQVFCVWAWHLFKKCEIMITKNQEKNTTLGRRNYRSQVVCRFPTISYVKNKTRERNNALTCCGNVWFQRPHQFPVRATVGLRRGNWLKKNDTIAVTISPSSTLIKRKEVYCIPGLLHFRCRHVSVREILLIPIFLCSIAFSTTTRSMPPPPEERSNESSPSTPSLGLSMHTCFGIEQTTMIIWVMGGTVVYN